jgi:hypothetical protein
MDEGLLGGVTEMRRTGRADEKGQPARILTGACLGTSPARPQRPAQGTGPWCAVTPPGLNRRRPVLYVHGLMAPPRDPIQAWRSIVPLILDRVQGLIDAELDRPTGENRMSLRETVHHVVEANVVAAGILTAALGSPGSVFDWSWMLPFGPWMEHMRYDRKPIGPSLDLLRALNAYIVAQIAPLPDALQRTVLLVDAPGAKPRTATVADVLLQEAMHAHEEFGEEGSAEPGGS